MSSPVRHVVRRQGYAPSDRSGVSRVWPEHWTPAATFARPSDADAEYAKLLAQFRRTVNPFQLGGPNLFYQTSLPPFALHDYLLDHGLTPPPNATSTNPNYVFWWVKNNRTFTDEQRAAVWRACDKLDPFAVVEEDARRAVHVVVEGEWLEQHNPVTPFDGGDAPYMVQVPDRYHLRGVYRSRREAERGRKKWEEQLREEGEDDGRVYFDATGHTFDWANAPHTGVLAVPLAGDPPTDSAFVVTRGRYPGEAAAAAGVREQLGYGGGRVPLVVAADGETAEEIAADWRRRARKAANPFALLTDDFTRPYRTEHTIGDDEDVTELPNGLKLEDAVDCVRRLDLRPPPPDSPLDGWADWYDRVVQWSPEYIDVIWGTFADFRLFEVAEVPCG